jgi:hypothetical protein
LLLGKARLAKASIRLLLALFRLAFLEFTLGARFTRLIGLTQVRRALLTRTRIRRPMGMSPARRVKLIGLDVIFTIRHMRKPLHVTRLAHWTIFGGLARATLVGARDQISLWSMRPPTLGPQPTRFTIGARLGVNKCALVSLLASRRMVEEVANFGGFVNCGHG